MREDPDQEDLPELDVVDPLKRGEEQEEEHPGIDPIVTIPPES